MRSAVAAPIASQANDLKLKGPMLVALGAAGWGTEGLWRRRLDARLAPYPIVLLEHLIQVIFTLPWLIKNAWLIRHIPRRALFYVILSGSVGSALGTVCFTAAVGTNVNMTAASVLLCLQPVVSTFAAAVLFGERIKGQFYIWAPLAVGAGVVMSLDTFSVEGLTVLRHTQGFGYIALTIVLWGFATVAGRGAMRELPLGLAAPLRLWAGLLTTALVLGLRWLAGKGGLDLTPLTDWHVLLDLGLLTTVSGSLPLFIYFAGLATTPAALAGYCEMFYTISAALIGWLAFGGTLGPHRLIAGVVLIGAVVLLNRAALVNRRS